jgi:hypothetical protein
VVVALAFAAGGLACGEAPLASDDAFPPLASVVISPAAATMPRGSARAFTATVSFGGPVEWTVLDSLVVRVEAEAGETGVVTIRAHRVGSTPICASAVAEPGVKGCVNVQVLE